MTRQEFRRVAMVIAELKVSEKTRRTVARDFAEMYALAAPRFDQERFLSACEPAELADKLGGQKGERLL